MVPQQVHAQISFRRPFRAGDGTFANGAETAAFGYLFNACGGKNGCAIVGGGVGTAVGVGAAGACDYASAGACIAANGPMVGAFGAAGAATGAFMDAWFDSAANDTPESTPIPPTARRALRSII